jgi:RecB family exonuclease
MNNIIKISPSSVQTLEQCPRKWFHRYIEKIYPDVPDNDAAAFGEFIHDIAEHYSGDSLETLKELAKQTLKHYTIAADYKSKVIPAIKNFYIYYMKKFRKDGVLDRERKIEIPYEDNFLLTGKIDVLYAEGNKVCIIDWKTSKSEKDHSFQLSFYYYVLKLMNLIDVDQLECEIVYLCPEDTMELYVSKYTLDKSDMESAAARIKNLMEYTKKLGTNKDKWRKKLGPLCNWCDYKKANICSGKE